MCFRDDYFQPKTGTHKLIGLIGYKKAIHLAINEILGQQINDVNDGFMTILIRMAVLNVFYV